ncbi:cuticle protein 76-like [Sipha flava]|uniref:Cuticle protein 76-like n=1 Tax=Sipha flava TaxID=143950 RepID=A0A8B8G0Z6_9HEMI|nr:cuticle protein 76-like [Sipha flava]
MISFKFLLCTVVLIMAAVTVTIGADDTAAAADITAAEPSVYSPAYLPPKHNPYDGAVTSTSTNIIRTPGNFGQVAAFHKTVETPFSLAHKADVRFTNDVVQPYQPSGPYPYAASPYPYAVGPYPYGAGPYPYATGPANAASPYPYTTSDPYKAYGYGLSAAPVAVPYGYNPIAVPQATGPYGYGSTAGAPVTSHAVVTPHSVAHTSFSGPYGSHYSYKR